MKPRAPAASWADTGRYTPPPKRERLRDLVELAACLQAGRRVPPLLALWFAKAVERLDDQLAAGGRPNLHRLLDLPDRAPVRAWRGRVRHERDNGLRAIASALPAELTSWQRAKALHQLLEDPSRPAPDGARGYVATMRAEVLGKVPRSVRALHRIITH